MENIYCVAFQINKVPSGGRTVFPRIGVSVKPIAGSAIFWYNLHDTGEPDRLTLHGACPVLYGTKWGMILEKLTSSTALSMKFYLEMMLLDPLKTC